MSARSHTLVARFVLPAGLLAVALCGGPPAIDRAWSQTAPEAPLFGLQEQPPPAAPRLEPSPAASPSQDNPGLLHEIGKLFEKSLSVLPPLKSPTEAIDDLNARARETAKETIKDAGETLSRLGSPSSMVAGRTICPVAANGRPDCGAGADRLCQSKGYKEGKSLNTDAAETCSAKVYIPGRPRKPGDCRTDSYVTAALCQ